MNTVIKTVDFSDVHPLVAKSYETLYNATMRRALGPELLKLFAPVQTSAKAVRWFLPDGVTGSFCSIAEAPEDLQGILLLLWEEKRSAIQDILQKLPSKGDLELILTVPRINYIYYKEVPGAERDVPNQRFQLLVTGWAYEFGNPKDKGGDVATNKKMEAANNHQDVTLVLLDEKGEQIRNSAFEYVSESRNIRRGFVSDDQGCYTMGLCLVGDVFECVYKLTGQSRSFEVLKNIPKYNLQFSPFVKAAVRVVNQRGESQPKVAVKASYGNQTWELVTDGLGELKIPDILYLDSNVLMHLTAGDSMLDVHVSTISSQNNYVIEIHTSDPMNVQLLVTINGSAAPGYSVRIKAKENTVIYATDESGIIPLPFLQEGDIFYVESVTDDSKKQTLAVVSGIEQYEFAITELAAVTPRRHLVVRDSSGTELPFFIVRVKYNGVVQEMQTDASGRILLPAEWKSGDTFTVEPAAENGKDSSSAVINISLADEESVSADFVIEEDKDEYVYQLPDLQKPYVGPRYIIVQDADGNPVPFYNLQLSYKDVPELRICNMKACITIPKEWSDGEWFEAFDPKTGMSQKYMLQPDVIEYVFRLPAQTDMQYAVVRVVNDADVPVADYPLSIQIGEDINQGATDADGLYKLGELEVGTVFTVADGHNSSLQQHYKIEKGRDEYVFRISEDAGPVYVQLIDKHKQPVPNAQINLKNKRGEVFSHYADHDGTIEVPREFFTNGETVYVNTVLSSAKVKDTKFKYDEGYNHYIIRLKDPFPWGCLWRILLLLFLMMLMLVRCNKDITIATLAADDTPLPGTFVNFRYTEHQLYKNGKLFYSEDHINSGVSDSTGRITFKKQPCSVFSWIFYTFQKAYVDGQNNGMIATGDFVFHWQFRDYKLYFANDAVIQVVSASTGQPIAGASVKLWTNDPLCSDVSLYTDIQGLCTFRYANSGNTVDKLLVTKSGYSGALFNDFSLSEFDDQIIIIELDDQSQCNTEVNNSARDKGNHAVQDFIMGDDISAASGMQFQFDYYTDSAPDHIMVYGGSSAEYASGTAPLLWEYFGATNTQDYTREYSVNIPLSSSVVCVVVDEGTNWGYYIHCPNIIK